LNAEVACSNFTQGREYVRGFSYRDRWPDGSPIFRPTVWTINKTSNEVWVENCIAVSTTVITSVYLRKCRTTCTSLFQRRRT